MIRLADSIVYLRAGRKVRAAGTVTEIDRVRKLTRVIPNHGNWRSVWLTAAEIAAGREKPPIVPRKPRQHDATPKPKPRHHPALVAAWRHLHDGIAPELIPEPGPTFVVAWNLGYEQARHDAGTILPLPTTQQHEPTAIPRKNRPKGVQRHAPPVPAANPKTADYPHRSSDLG